MFNWSEGDYCLRACLAAEEWLDQWASAESYISVIREAIAKATNKE